MDIVATLAEELGLKPPAVEAVIQLIDEGNTIPFIARYRKEATGGMDDAQLRTFDERLAYLRNLEARKAEVLHAIDEQGKLTSLYLKVVLVLSLIAGLIYGLWLLCANWNRRKPTKKIHRRY